MKKYVPIKGPHGPILALFTIDRDRLGRLTEPTWDLRKAVQRLYGLPPLVRPFCGHFPIARGINGRLAKPSYYVHWPERGFRLRLVAAYPPLGRHMRSEGYRVIRESGDHQTRGVHVDRRRTASDREGLHRS